MQMRGRENNELTSAVSNNKRLFKLIVILYYYTNARKPLITNVKDTHERTQSAGRPFCQSITTLVHKRASFPKISLSKFWECHCRPRE